MSDLFLDFVQTPMGRSFSQALGLPMPPKLERAKTPFDLMPLTGRTVLLGAGPAPRVAGLLVGALAKMGARVAVATELAGMNEVKDAARSAEVTLVSESEKGPQGYVLDATGLKSLADLKTLHLFFSPRLRAVPPNAKVVVVAADPDTVAEPMAAAAAASVTGFVKSLAKEIGKNGATANLVYVAPGGEGQVEGALRFFLTPHSAYVDGQPVTVTAGPDGLTLPATDKSLDGKVALVTGAARGIGQAIARTLAREGATVIGMDRPQEEGELAATLAPLGGFGIALDVTSPQAGARVAQEASERFGGLDLVVHNAGITRDKMLRNMSPALWDQVLGINLGAISRIDDTLFAEGAFKPGARVVGISSIGGIAGNAGQTNYGTTKAGVIGYVAARARAQKDVAFNAVAPGFIETQMTAAIPVVNREVGRRICSLAQGGLPIDIAEAVTWLGGPYAGGVNGQVLRVCGQNWLGA